MTATKSKKSTVSSEQVELVDVANTPKGDLLKITVKQRNALKEAHGYLTRIEMIQELNCSPNQFADYMACGMPAIVPSSRGAPALYDLEQCKEWLREKNRLEDPKDLAEAKLRKLSAEASLAELALKKSRGELVEIAEVVSLYEAAMSNVRAKLLAVPTKSSGLVLGLQKQTDVQLVLENAIREVLEELSTLEEYVAGNKAV